MHEAPATGGQGPDDRAYAELRKLEEEIGLCPATSYHQREPAAPQPPPGRSREEADEEFRYELGRYGPPPQAQPPDAEAVAGAANAAWQATVAAAQVFEGPRHAFIQGYIGAASEVHDLQAEVEMLREREHLARAASAGVAALRASLEAAEGERDALREALRCEGHAAQGQCFAESSLAQRGGCLGCAVLAPKEATK